MNCEFTPKDTPDKPCSRRGVVPYWDEAEQKQLWLCRRHARVRQGQDNKRKWATVKEGE